MPQDTQPELPARALIVCLTWPMLGAQAPTGHGHGPPTHAHLCTWSMLARNTLCDRRFLSMSVIWSPMVLWSPMVVEDRLASLHSAGGLLNSPITRLAVVGPIPSGHPKIQKPNLPRLHKSCFIILTVLLIIIVKNCSSISGGLASAGVLW